MNNQIYVFLKAYKPNEELNVFQSDPNETSGQPQRDPPSQQETPESNEVSSSQPGIVIYIVDPFSYGTEPDSISRLAMIGLLKCYQQMALPEHLANNLCLQVITIILLFFSYLIIFIEFC